ncbi:hypothetical protein N8987_02625 [Crocinitomix sp.]|nr:hypothetical protein [Crocinitomix sp.]
MKRILFFAIIAFCEISFAQDCLYSDEVGKFTNTRTQTSNGAPFKSNGVTYNLYFIEVSSDSSSSYYLKFAKNTPGISSQYVTKGDKLIN